jgi:integrase
MSYISNNWCIHTDQGQRKYITDAERACFLVRADSLRPDLRALSYVLTYSGCRISEALALTIDHLDVSASALTIRTLKRRKLVFRIVPIPLALTRQLLALPLSSDKRFFSICRSTAWRHLKRTLEVAGASGASATCKGLRHGFGIRAASKSVPLNIIQRWMGHANMTTTAHYLNAVGDVERLFAERMW